MPSCGKATICRPITSRTRSRSSTRASRATRRGSVTSQWLRTCSTPCAACQRRTCSARVEHVVARHVRLALGPDGDALPERPRGVPARLAGGQRGVEVDVRLDERRRDQRTRGVDLDVGRRGRRPRVVRRDGREPAVPHLEVDQVGPPGERCGPDPQRSSGSSTDRGLEVPGGAAARAGHRVDDAGRQRTGQPRQVDVAQHLAPGPWSAVGMPNSKNQVATMPTRNGGDRVPAVVAQAAASRLVVEGRDVDAAAGRSSRSAPA